MSITLVEATERVRRTPTWTTPRGSRRGYLNPSFRDYRKLPRLYVHPANETVYENFVLGGRWNRPTREYRRLLPEILQALGLPADTRATWSQKAGCSCGCSPGFVLDGTGTEHVDYFATVK